MGKKPKAKIVFRNFLMDLKLWEWKKLFVRIFSGAIRTNAIVCPHSIVCILLRSESELSCLGHQSGTRLYILYIHPCLVDAIQIFFKVLAPLDRK